jgi:hypothetical protein
MDRDSRYLDHSRRRDCPPHRGNWLLLFAIFSLVWAFGSCLFFPVLISGPIAVYVHDAARKDLGLMREGQLDPNGRRITERARYYADWAMVVNVAGLLLLVLLPAIGLFFR